MNQFTQDLSIGQLAERAFVTTMANYSTKLTDFEYNTSADLEGLKKYDVKFKVNGKEATAEVKHDLKASQTGNLAIEYMNHKGDKTGILATESYFYVFLVGEVFYIFKTVELKKLAFNSTKKWKYVTSSSGNAELILIPLSEAKKYAHFTINK